MPAARSPSRWLRRVASTEITAPAPDVSGKSTIPRAVLMAAWRKVMGPPSVVTTRSPSAALPTVRPRHSVSNATGYPKMIRNDIRMRKAIPTPPRSPPVKAMLAMSRANRAAN